MERKWMAHLLRRAGFGWNPAEEREFLALGFEGAVERLVGELAAPAPADPPGFDPYQPRAAEREWLRRMHSGKGRLAEKLALFWHGHFATSNAKVGDGGLMWRQYRLFREKGGGRFADLVLGVSRDVAMIRWLDGTSNRRSSPNENYARELMELFTLGVGNYSERDVKEAARAFTGWSARRDRFVFQPEHHDGGTKTVLGRTGPWNGEDVVRILGEHPQCARFLAGRLLRFFTVPDPTEAEVERMAAAYRRSGGQLDEVLKGLFLDPVFRSDRSYRALVKSPAEFLVGALRCAGVDGVPEDAPEILDRMGQSLFYPPSVKGWVDHTEWLAAAPLVERMHAAAEVAALAGAPTAVLERLAYDGPAAEVPAGPNRRPLLLAAPGFQLN